MPSLIHKLLLFSGGAAAFSPSDISGLVAWYDASDAATLWEDSARTIQAADNADVIGAWDDKSGNGYHVIQATTANKPTLRTSIQNSKSGIRFDGTDDLLTNTSFPDFGDTYTLFVVGKYAVSVDITQGLLEVSNGTTNTGFSLLHDTLSTWRGRDSTQNRNITGDDIRDASVNIFEGTNSGTLLEYLRNGVSKGTVAYTAPNPNTLNRLDLGRFASVGSFALNGDMFEVLIYNRLLTSDEKTNTRNCLNTKWAVY